MKHTPALTKQKRLPFHSNLWVSKEKLLKTSLMIKQWVSIPNSTIRCDSTYAKLKFINYAFGTGKFPKCFKMKNVTPVHEWDVTTDKETYRQICELSLLSKIFERLIYEQLSKHIKKCLTT